MDQGTIGIAVITIGVNLFGWFFLSTGRFQSEYQSNNKKVEAVLFEEFHQHLEELRLKEKEFEIQGKEKDSLYKDDKVLMKKFDELTDWKMHIQNGKKDLRIFSFFALVAMVLIGISIMIYPSSGASNRSD